MNTQRDAFDRERRDVDASPAGPADRAARVPLLGDAVLDAVREYFRRLDGAGTTDLYDLLLRQVEPPLLRAVLEHTDNNQSRAARILGLNRGTLRKKMKRYGFLQESDQ